MTRKHLGRNAEPVDAGSLQELIADFSIEVTPRETLRHPGLLADVLQPNTSVYITYLANGSFEDTVNAVRSVRDQGMVPVPHLAARSVQNLQTLDAMVGQLTSAGADELLVVAGSLPRPAGEIYDSMQVLASGALQRHGIQKVGVAGHPEGNQDIADQDLASALAAKNRFADQTGIPTRLVTQFCFAAEPIIEWEQRIRNAGNRLPVHVGLPGLTSPARLLTFGLACGVGPSLKVLRKQAGGLLKLATTPQYFPDQTLAGLTKARSADPASLLSAVHFFPFGALAETARWLDDLAAGDVILADHRLETTK